MVCRDFILPEICKPCLFLFFYLRNLLYLIPPPSARRCKAGYRCRQWTVRPTSPVITATPTCRQRNVPGAPGRWDGKFENCCANDIKVMLRGNPLRSMISEDFHSMGRKDPASLNWLLCSVFYFTLLIFKAIKQKIGENHCAVYRDFGVMLAWMFYRSVPICNTI